MSKLNFPNLQRLVPDMLRLKVEKEHFSFNYANNRIDCVFCFHEKQFELLVAVHILNYGFVINIYKNQKDEYIAELSDEDYRGFCNALHLTYKNDGFTSNTLLNLLSKHVPTISTGVGVKYQEMRDYLVCRHIDEEEKIYFKGWNDHIRDGKKAQNFDKTEYYFGKTVADFCRQNNISSIWTHKQTEETVYHNPWK